MAQTLPLGDTPRALYTVDLDVDGDVDLVANNANGPAVTLAFGDGFGSFGPELDAGVMPGIGRPAAPAQIDELLRGRRPRCVSCAP